MKESKRERDAHVHTRIHTHKSITERVQTHTRLHTRARFLLFFPFLDLCFPLFLMQRPPTRLSTPFFASVFLFLAFPCRFCPDSFLFLFTTLWSWASSAPLSQYRCVCSRSGCEHTCVLRLSICLYLRVCVHPSVFNDSSYTRLPAYTRLSVYARFLTCPPCSSVPALCRTSPPGRASSGPCSTSARDRAGRDRQRERGRRERERRRRERRRRVARSKMCCPALCLSACSAPRRPSSCRHSA